MRTLGAAVLCLWCLLAPALAQPLQVHSDRPGTFYWRVSQQTEWIEFGQGNDAVLDRPDSSQVDVSVVGYKNPLYDWYGQRGPITVVTDRCELRTTERLAGLRAGLSLASLILLLSLVYLALRVLRHRQALEHVEHTYIQALDAQNVATLFRTDGTHPEKIGNYTVKKHLGTGGMAIVYQVAAPDGSVYALKLPHPQFGTDREFRERFSREMRLGASVMHPNVARILDYQLPTSEAEYPYYVMEYVPGQNWARHLERQPPPVKDVLRWTRGVLQGLEHVHAKGIIHRDIKPENVVISETGLAKLMDFGIAKEMQARTLLTKPDEAVGTPAYMAPEQLTSGPIGPPTDLYAVGLMVYASLSKLPFDENDLPGILMFKVTGNPMPPLDRLDLPPEVTDWVMRMIDPDPAKRFAQASEARLALERVMEKLA